MKKLFFLMITVVTAINLSAQNTKPSSKREEKDERKQERRKKIDNLIRQQEEGALVFNKQNVFGLKLNTDGWGLIYEKGFMKNVKVTNLFSLEFAEKKHPKESKQSFQVANGPFIAFSTPYVYGKQNIFYQLKPGFAQQRLIGGKTNRNGVAVHAIYGGGISLGLERPYYVTVRSDPNNNTRDIKYSQQDSILFLTPGNIIQGTGFKYGWRDMKLVPGAHAKVAIRFDYGRFNEMVSAIEIGINAEVYSREVSIMLLNPSNRFFFNSYVAILFGKRK
ncbi:MAG TPA: hypothetical protein VFV46_10815 [Lacibacter sp.]|nr:hypothetical protein [Lacibacter sp.]